MEKEDEPGRAETWVWRIGAYLVLFAYGLLTLSLAITTFRQTGFTGWSLLKNINEHIGSLLGPVVAFIALTIAYREYRTKNSPSFVGKVTVTHGEDIYFEINVESLFEKAIHLETTILRIDKPLKVTSSSRVDVLAPKEKMNVVRVIFPGGNYLAGEVAHLEVQCLGRSAVNLDCRSLLTIECILSIDRIGPGGTNAIERYNIRPLGLLQGLPTKRVIGCQP